MGAGDWLMAAGEARALHEKTGKPVAIVDARAHDGADLGLVIEQP